MNQVRTAGLLLLLSGIVGYLGQFVAMYLWFGIYSLEFNFLSDLGMSACMQVEDRFMSRHVCSPGYHWFNWGTIAAGLLQLIAGALLWRSADAGQPGRERRGFRPVGLALLVAGLAGIGVGAISFNVSPLWHDLSAIAVVLGHWAAMILAAVSTIRVLRLPRVGDVSAQPAPLLGLAPMVLTWLLLAVSVAGAVMLLAAAPTAPAGIFERLAVDPLRIWLFALGASLLGAGVARRRQARESARAKAVEERAQRDAAVRRVVQE